MFSSQGEAVCHDALGQVARAVDHVQMRECSDGTLKPFVVRALDEFVAHYHGERNHQGLGNELITPAAAGAGGTQVRCRDRLGGLLRY